MTVQSISLSLAYRGFGVGAKMKCLIDSEWLLITDVSRVRSGYKRFTYQITFENGYKTVFGDGEKIEITNVEE